MSCNSFKSPNAAQRPETEPRPKTRSQFLQTITLLLNDNSLETLGIFDVDGLDVAVELLFGTLLVVTSPGNADAESERNTLDTLLPDLLV